jgi:putative glutathione S-transferase
MGLLVDGKWQDKWYDTATSGGRFARSESQFRNWVTVDGKAGPTGKAGFKAETNRYHLYLSHACPWAHRTAIMRSIKGLEEIISVSFVSPIMLADGWTYDKETGSTGDSLFGFGFHHQVYTKADPTYTGRVTVPVLWDKVKNTIVSNESSDIIRMLNNAFNETGATDGDYWPEDIRDEIEVINARVYHEVNNGVYKAGFATSQAAYEEAVYPLFEALDWLEGILKTKRYLLGNHLTEADIRLFTTLVRFDPVYFGHFKCNIKSIESYPALKGFVQDIYQIPSVAGTCNMEHIKTHYYASHRTINPTAIVPVGTGFDLNKPHGRDAI